MRSASEGRRISKTVASTRCPPQSTLHAKETARDCQELVETIVMHPVAGLVDRHRFSMFERLDAPILDPIARPRFRAANQQGRAGDAAPYIARVAVVEHVGRRGVNVIVELPGVSAVLVAANSPNGEMARLLAAEVRIGLDHAGQR